MTQTFIVMPAVITWPLATLRMGCFYRLFWDLLMAPTVGDASDLPAREGITVLGLVVRHSVDSDPAVGSVRAGPTSAAHS